MRQIAGKYGQEDNSSTMSVTCKNNAHADANAAHCTGQPLKSCDYAFSLITEAISLLRIIITGCVASGVAVIRKSRHNDL